MDTHVTMQEQITKMQETIERLEACIDPQTKRMRTVSGNPLETGNDDQQRPAPREILTHSDGHEPVALPRQPEEPH